MPALLMLLACSAPAARPGPRPEPPEPTVRPLDTAPPSLVSTGCEGLPLTLVPGVGRDAFVPVEDGDIVTIVKSPEIGWWVYFGMSLNGVGRAVSFLPTITMRDTGEVVSGAQGTLDFNYALLAPIETGDCAGSVFGQKAWVDDFPDVDHQTQLEPLPEVVCALDGRPATLAWLVTDLGDGDEAVARVDVTLALEPWLLLGDYDGDGCTFCDGDYADWDPTWPEGGCG